MIASGIKQLDTLRSAAAQLQPLGLTTGYGDVLDTICQNYYGHLNGAVEAVLDANQGLAEEVQPFKAGLVIHLPDLPVPSDEVVMLWG